MRVVQGLATLPPGLRPAHEPDWGLWGPKHALVHVPHPPTFIHTEAENVQ